MTATLVTILVGCASGTAVPSLSTPTQPGGATVAPSATTSGNGAATNICALLPVDQVAQITGKPITGSLQLHDFLTTNDARCQYGEDNDVVIDVIYPGGTAYYNNLASGYAANIIPITGVGDKAFQDFTDGSGMLALFGDAAYDVYIDDANQTISEDDINRASEQLIETLHAKL